MYCPKCASDNHSDQNFCRGCGLDLAPVSKALAGGPAAAGPNTIKQLSAFSRSPMFRWGFVALWLGLLLVIGMGVGGDMVTRFSRPLGRLINDATGLAVLPLLAGAGLMAYSILFPSPKGSPVDVSPLRPVPTNSLNEGHDAIQPPAPSISEHTTYRLDKKDAETPSRKSEMI